MMSNIYQNEKKKLAKLLKVGLLIPRNSFIEYQPDDSGRENEQIVAALVIKFNHLRTTCDER